MRNAIRNKLITEMPTIPVRQITTVNKNTQKPFIVIVKADEVQTNISMAFDSIYLIFAYISINSDLNDLDSITNTIKNVLHESSLTEGGINFSPKYIGHYGNEFVEENFNAIGQGLQFSIENLVGNI
jgi:hypothetical protein